MSSSVPIQHSVSTMTTLVSFSTRNSDMRNRQQDELNSNTIYSVENGQLRSAGSYRYLVGSATVKQARINLQWKNISVSTKKGKVILNNVSGQVCAGQLTAIMGPSGAGKTTLLDVLTGFKRKNVNGEVMVNGKPRDQRLFRKTSAYVMQEPCLQTTLTVQESVTFAAQLKLDSDTPKEEKSNAVNECIEQLGLTHCKDTKVSVLSGGEKKRVSIAISIISNPVVIFLDEPTSGLDSASCVQCVNLLRTLAREGKTIICTIHQPTYKILEAFDQLYVVAEGLCIYRGSVPNLVPFLQSQDISCSQYKNPVEVLIDVATEEGRERNLKLSRAVQLLQDSLSVSSSSNELQSADNTTHVSTSSLSSEAKSENWLESSFTGYATSSFQQFRILVKRNLICTYREPVMTQARFVCQIVFGLLMGILYYGKGNDADSALNITAFLVMSCGFLLFTSSIPPMLSFPIEKRTVAWEHMNCWYSLKVYYLVKIIIETILQSVLATIYSSIVYWMTDQPNDLWRFGLFLLSCISICLAMQSMMIIVGLLFSQQTSAYLGTSLNFPFFLFSGFFITLENTPYYMRWLIHVSFMHYGFHSIMHVIYGMDRPDFSCAKETCLVKNPQHFLEVMGMNYGSIYTDYAVLLGFTVVFRILTYFMLSWRMKRYH